MICHDCLKVSRGVRTLAEKDGRPLQALVDEAFADLIEKRKHAKPCQLVMAGCVFGASYAASLINRL